MMWTPSGLVRVVKVLVGLAVALVCTVAAASPSDWAYYFYFKEKRPLTQDRGRIAIYDRQEFGTGQVRDFLRSAGYDEAEIEPLAITGWSLFMMRNASGSAEIAGFATSREEDISEEIDRLIVLDTHRRLFFAPVFDGELGPIVPTPTILVRFRDDATASEIDAALQQVGLGAALRHPWGDVAGYYKIEPEARSGIAVLRLANRLAQRDEVIAAEADMMSRGTSGYIPSDPFFSITWGLHNTGQSYGNPDMDIDAPEAWDKTEGSPSIITLIIDTGVQQDHPDLHQLPGADFTGQGGGGGPINECDNHGTSVAGVVASAIDNGLGTVGVAPHAWIASARPFISNIPCSAGWSTFSSWTVDALNWAESIGARVTNNSNGYDPASQSSLIAQRYAETQADGMMHFACAGNNSLNQVWYPASLSSVHAVSAIRRDGRRSTFSNYNSEVEFTAPGEEIVSTDRTGLDGWVSGDYGTDFWGTSFASPMVAGVAALLFSYSPWLDADEGYGLLRDCSVDLVPIGRDIYYGWGLPKAECAMEALGRFSDDFESGDLSHWSEVSP